MRILAPLFWLLAIICGIISIGNAMQPEYTVDMGASMKGIQFAVFSVGFMLAALLTHKGGGSGTGGSDPKGDL